MKVKWGGGNGVERWLNERVGGRWWEGWGGGVASLCQLPSCEAPRNKSDLISLKHVKTRLPISVLSQHVSVWHFKFNRSLTNVAVLFKEGVCV